MRHASLLLFCFLTIFASLSAAQTTHRRPAPKTQSDTSATEDRAAIQELYDREIKANLALDVKALELLWDPEIVSLPPGHTAISGLEANRAYLEGQAKELENFQILGYEQAWQEVRILGDYAYEFGTIQTRIGPMNPGPEVDSTYNVMRILKKQPDGAWKVYRAIWNNASAPKSEKQGETPEKKSPAPE